MYSNVPGVGNQYVEASMIDLFPELRFCTVWVHQTSGYELDLPSG